METVLYLGLLALLPPLATSHPQCLNFQPPFSAEGFDLTHCAEYDELGCCENVRLAERVAVLKFLYILKTGMGSV